MSHALEHGDERRGWIRDRLLPTNAMAVLFWCLALVGLSSCILPLVSDLPMMLMGAGVTYSLLAIPCITQAESPLWRTRGAPLVAVSLVLYLASLAYNA